jgi:hypothetical protein
MATDTDPAPAPESDELKAIKAVHALVANLALEVDSLKHRVENAGDEARLARSSAQVAADEAKRLRGETRGALESLDKKLSDIALRLASTVDSLTVIANGHGHTLLDHQTRLERLGAYDHDHAANGNGAGE